MALRPAQHPDRLVAFLAHVDGDERLMDGGGSFVQELIDRATEANLTDGSLTVPEYDPDEGDLDDAGKRVQQLHEWAYALTGSSAKARMAIAQLSDGETPGMLGTGPDQVGELVHEVADRIARA